MIATRFRSVAWTGCVCAAALSFYMVSQTVAAKRAELAGVERKILATHQEIRDLRTALDTRGGLAQLENWNATVYGLQAPGAEQFVNSAVQLVAMTQPQQQPLDPGAPIVAGQNQGSIRQASYDAIEDSTAPVSRATAPVETAQASTPTPEARPMIRQANFVQARPSAMAPATPPIHIVASRKPATVAATIKLTALDDNWLADVTGDKSGNRARKAKP